MAKSVKPRKCFVGKDIPGIDLIRKVVCRTLPVDFQSSEQWYCVLHFPDRLKDGNTDFENVIRSRLARKLYDFRGVFFPKEIGFHGVRFADAAYFNHADFFSAVFDNCVFEEISMFSETKFSVASFRGASFKNRCFFQSSVVRGTGFDEVDYKSADFTGAFFSDAVFQDAVFNKAAIFNDARFREASFLRAHFKSTVTFFSTQFSETVSFASAQFDGEATFHSAKFSRNRKDDPAHIIASFDEAIIRKMTFTASQCDGVSFDKAQIHYIQVWESMFRGNVFFRSATVEEADFYKVEFGSFAWFDKTAFLGRITFLESRFTGEASFVDTTLNEGCDFVFKDTILENGISFSSSNVMGFLAFQGKRDQPLCIAASAVLDLQYIKNPTPERIRFQTVQLRPNWFVNVDVKKFVFTACKWQRERSKDITARTETLALQERGIDYPNKLLNKTCWQLALNFEEAQGFTTASFFRKLANESKRLEEWKGFKINSLHWWYAVSSFYGESPKLAFGVLLGLFLAFTIYYYFAFFNVCELNALTSCMVRTLSISEAIHQSLMTGSFQEVNYRSPLTYPQELVMLLERILVPLQAALLALAIRRRFMT